MESASVHEDAERLLQDMVAFDVSVRESGGVGLNRATGEVWQDCDTSKDGSALRVLEACRLIERKTRYKHQTRQRFAVTDAGLSYFSCGDGSDPDDEESERCDEGFAKSLIREAARGFGEGAGKAATSAMFGSPPQA